MPSQVLITGGSGQLGLELQAVAPPAFETVAPLRDHFDLTNQVIVQEAIASIQPEVIINAAAYTAVDLAEQESETAMAVNRDVPKLLAGLAKDMGIKLIHLSTDFVFDGLKSSPYDPDDAAKPLGIYGQSKLAGEEAILSLLPAHCLIVRTSWLYSVHKKNFVKTMLGLMQEREELSVVTDQVGAPTWARGLAQALWDCVKKDLHGIYHWSDAGVASWYDFAVAIQEEGLALGLLNNEIEIKPVSTLEFQTPAKRPAFSVLDKTKTWRDLGYFAPHWRKNLRSMLIELKRITDSDVFV